MTLLRGFDEQPPRMAVAGLGDAALAPLVAAGVFAGHQAEVGHELPRMPETPRASEFTDQDHGSDHGEAAQTHHGLDDRSGGGHREAGGRASSAVDRKLREPPREDEAPRPRVDGSRRCRPSD